ncbi:hypothetical protein ACS0TY_027937 [Phlomoides rotata]
MDNRREKIQKTSEKNQEERETAPWSDLNQDILGVILGKLQRPVDLIRSRAVCKNWRMPWDRIYFSEADTSATTIEWAVYEVLRHPHAIKKAKEELDRIIGRNRWVQETDLSQLPYIEYIIMETFRVHPVGTLLAPHCAINDCKVAGYDIAKGKMVLINTWSIGRDPNSWDTPEKFLPERFIGKEIDALGSIFSLFPFGSGRRGCPGYNFALKMVLTTFANLLHGFNLVLVEGMKPQDICMEEKYGLSTHPKLPISIIMEPTLPPHLY